MGSETQREAVAMPRRSFAAPLLVPHGARVRRASWQSVPGTIPARFELRIVLHKPFLERGKLPGPNVIVLVLKHHDDNGHLLFMCCRVHGTPMVGEVLNEVLAIGSAVSENQSFMIGVCTLREGCVELLDKIISFRA